MNFRSIRILHTSDWHVGKTNGKISRREDVEYALNEIKKTVKSEKIDYLVVCGDIFDKPQVANQDAELVWNFFLEISSLKVHSILLSGNHDSQDFLKSVKPLLRLAKTYIYDRMVPSSEILQKSILLHDEKQKICFFVVPYPHPSHITKITHDIYTRAIRYSDGVANYLEEGVNKILEKYGKDTKIVILSHLSVTDAEPSGSEREISVLSQFSVDWGKLPKNVVYYGLGHIHKMQEVKNPDVKIYYSGSIFQIDFSEQNEEEKYCLLVEIPENSMKADVKPPIKLTLKRKLKTFEYDLDEKNELRINQILQELENHKNTLKKVVIKGNKAPKPELIDKINQIEGVVHLSIQKKPIVSNVAPPKDINQNSDILTLYEKYCLEYKRSKKDEFATIKNKLIEILEEIKKAEGNL